MIMNRKPPYANTEADPERTKGQISKLLRDYGINKSNWTEDFELQRVMLTFETEAEIKGVKKRIVIQVEPPTFAKQRRTYDAKLGHTVKIDLPNWAQSYRMLYHWLKAKIEAIAYGLTTVEQEFLAQVVVQLPSGETTTFGKLIVDPEDTGRMLTFKSEEGKGFIQPHEESNATEASFTEVPPE